MWLAQRCAAAHAAGYQRAARRGPGPHRERRARAGLGRAGTRRPSAARRSPEHVPYLLRGQAQAHHRAVPDGAKPQRQPGQHRGVHEQLPRPEQVKHPAGMQDLDRAGPHDADVCWRPWPLGRNRGAGRRSSASAVAANVASSAPSTASNGGCTQRNTATWGACGARSRVGELEPYSVLTSPPR